MVPTGCPVPIGLPWQTTTGGEGDYTAHAIIKAAPTGYAVAGEAEATPEDDSDAYVALLTSKVEVVWSAAFECDGDDRAYDIDEASDAGYIVTSVRPASDTTGDGHLLKVDEDGKRA